MTESGHYRVQCRAPGCKRQHQIAGYCTKHYQQIRRHGRLTPEREYNRLGRHCRVESCERTPVAKGYCMRHYQQARRAGRIPLAPKGQAP